MPWMASALALLWMRCLALSASVSHTKTACSSTNAKALMSCSTSSGILPRSFKCLSRFTISSPSLPLIQNKLRLDNRSSFFLRHNYRFRLFCSYYGAGEKLRNNCLQRNIVNVVTYLKVLTSMYWKVNAYLEKIMDLDLRPLVGILKDRQTTVICKLQFVYCFT